MLKINADTICGLALRLLLIALIRAIWPGVKAAIRLGPTPEPSASIVLADEAARPTTLGRPNCPAPTQSPSIRMPSCTPHGGNQQ